ncbi:MAG: N-acetylneuraminate synthase family protein [Candidatus Nanoarchaeia archaeon]
MLTSIFSKLFIFEIANNHMGDFEHGKRIIQEFAKAAEPFKKEFNIAFKFQYRDLDTFIHPDYKNRNDIKYVKRFLETRLSEENFIALKNEIENLGFIPICTPFDEKSVERVEKHGYKILKIASCSFTDWPLLEKIAETKLPLIASTAGASVEDLDKVVSFLQHRNKNFCLMHCVGAYPTKAEELELNQIDFLKERYPGIPIGFSTHESPDNFDAIKMAIAKGAEIFERHIGLQTEKYQLNAYSSTPQQITAWLNAALYAFKTCGLRGARREISEKEREDLQGLKRGVFAQQKIQKGKTITTKDVFYAIPNFQNQLLAEDMSKYMEHVALEDIEANSPILHFIVSSRNKREQILEIIRKLCEILKKSGIRLQNKLDLEISHHYGLENFYKYGCSIINCINREYCKKIIILLPGQENPTHLHKLKEETFHVLYGDLQLRIGENIEKYKAGDIIVVERNLPHHFSSENGAVFEEVSTTHYKNDSYYNDPEIMKNNNRKTYMTFWSDWLEREIV